MICKKYILRTVVLLVFFVQSCTGTLNYVGEYHSKYSPYGVILNIDSTFNFYQNEKFNYEYSQGKWIFQSSNQLSLSSKIFALVGVISPTTHASATQQV